LLVFIAYLYAHARGLLRDHGARFPGFEGQSGFVFEAPAAGK